MSVQPFGPPKALEPALPAIASNGEASVQTAAAAAPTPGRLPRGKRKKSPWRIVVPIAGLLAVFGSVVVWFVWFRGPPVRTDLATDKVVFKDLQLKIVERGTLEAKDNHDVKCEVKAGSRGAPKIKWVVDNGASVKKGDLLVDIDDSYLQEQSQAKKIERDKAEAEKLAAEQLYPLKRIAILLADQNLEKWIRGDYPQQLHDLEGQIQISDSILLQQRDRTSWASRMVKKGYMTVSQEESEKANLRGDELNLQKLQEQKKVLTNYTDPVQRQSLENLVKQAKVDERTALSDMESKRAIFSQQDTLYKDLQEQIAQCKVYAPHSGIVVYSIPEQTRMGSGATQSIIAQGEPVQFGQKMLSIPDLTHMLVNMRVHEAHINNVREALPAKIRVDSRPDKLLNGHVKSVAQVASPQDWMSPDVKVYQSYLEIDDPVEELGLKPGLSAISTIYTEARVEHVLAVPLEAVLGQMERGAKPRCFVQTPTGVEPREVTLGLTDETYIEIKSGLKEGETVILNPRTLVTEKERKGSKEDEKNVPVRGKGTGKGGRPGGKGDMYPGGKGGAPGDWKDKGGGIATPPARQK